MKATLFNDRFSFPRLGALIMNRVYEDAPAFAVACAAIIGFNLLPLPFGSPPFFNQGKAEIWPLLIFLGGLFLAGRAFSRMHDGRAGSDWLLTPASSFEKYLAAAISYLLMYPLAATIAAWAISLTLAGIGMLVGTGGGRAWNPLSIDMLSGSFRYMLVAAFAMAGSARFRKLPLVKSAALVFAFTVFLGFVFMGGLAFFTEEGRNVVFRDGHLTFHGDMRLYGKELPQNKEAMLEIVGDILYYVSFAFAVLFGYFRVAEKEATDEVQ